MESRKALIVEYEIIAPRGFYFPLEVEQLFFLEVVTMNEYEKLIDEYHSDDLIIHEASLPYGLSGYYKDGVILIDKDMPTAQKYAVLSEELGHYMTSVGDILDQSVIDNRKQEITARRWGYDRIVPLVSLLGACRGSFDDIDEVIDNLCIDGEFLYLVLESYQKQYGDTVTLDGYELTFLPLSLKRIA